MVLLSHLHSHRRPLRRSLILLAIAATSLGIVAHAASQSLTLTYGKSVYTLTHNARLHRLECASNNTACVWRTAVSQNVADFRDVAAVATGGGPVIVYTEGNQTLFSLLHFRTGNVTVEGSGESLKGAIGQGWMLNCVMKPEQYGAKVICQTVVGNQVKEHKWDINMHGQHKRVGESVVGTYTAGQAAKSQAHTDSHLKVAFDVPRGFRVVPNDENSVALFGPTDLMTMTVFSDDGPLPLSELSEGYAKELGLTVTERSQEQLGQGQPALLVMGNGNIEGVESLHVALFFNGDARTYIVAYNARQDVGAAYVPAFEEIMRSLRPL